MEEMLHAENYNLTDIITPINVDTFARLLREAGYLEHKTVFFEQGFSSGFDIGYNGPKNRQSFSENIPLKLGTKTQLWNKIIKEVQLGRVAGPYDQVPFKNFMQSPVGLAPKEGKQDKFRLIFHLSYQFNDSKQGDSLNYHTPNEICTVKYNDLDYAVKTCLKAKAEQAKLETVESNQSKASHYRPIYLGKTDVCSVFHLVPLSRDSWAWLIMKVENPQTGKIQYFVNKCLLFGASISCALFQKVSDALKYLIEYRTKADKSMTNYLDDFLFVAITQLRCEFLLQKFIELCQEVGVPLLEEKTVWPTTRIVFLGILLDGVFMLLAIPEEKRNKAITLLRNLMRQKKATVKELQTLCGYLNFLNKAIYPGRVFVRRMYAKYQKFVQPTGRQQK